MDLRDPAVSTAPPPAPEASAFRAGAASGPISVARPREHLLLPVLPAPARAGEEEVLLCALVGLEFGERTVQQYLTVQSPVHRIDEAERNESR